MQLNKLKTNPQDIIHILKNMHNFLLYKIQKHKFRNGDKLDTNANHGW